MSPAAPKLADPGALIRDGKLPTDQFRACMDPDLLDEHAALVAARAVIQEAASDSMAGPDTTEVDAQLADVQERIDAATVVLQLRAMGRRAFGELRDLHPARRDDDGNVMPDDRRMGVNTDTIWDPLVRASIVAPELDDETVTLMIEQRLTDGQWAELTTRCWNLNERRISVPFSSAASPKTTNSAKK